MGRPKIYQVRQVKVEGGWSVINDETGARVYIHVRSRGKCDLYRQGHDTELYDTVAQAKHAAYEYVDGVPADVAKRRRLSGGQS